MNDDIQSVIRARDHLAEMYKDSEARLEKALDVLEEIANHGIDYPPEKYNDDEEWFRACFHRFQRWARVAIQTGQTE